MNSNKQTLIGDSDVGLVVRVDSIVGEAVVCAVAALGGAPVRLDHPDPLEVIGW